MSFPPELYKILEAITREKKVSVAWVVCEAAERWPLFRTEKRERYDRHG